MVPHSWRTMCLLAFALVAGQASMLLWFGQPLISAQGYIKLWEGAVLSAGNSQHIIDWYTFSHIIHGFLFYLGTRLLFPRMPVFQRILIAMGVEIAWELTENTPWVINHYREQALAQGYMGDSVINSVSDTCAMILGFLMAWRMPVWSIVSLGLAMEVFTGVMIRDNLTLNVLNLIYQFDVIHQWQSEVS